MYFEVNDCFDLSLYPSGFTFFIDSNFISIIVSQNVLTAISVLRVSSTARAITSLLL